MGVSQNRSIMVDISDPISATVIAFAGSSKRSRVQWIEHNVHNRKCEMWLQSLSRFLKESTFIQFVLKPSFSIFSI